MRNNGIFYTIIAILVAAAIYIFARKGIKDTEDSKDVYQPDCEPSISEQKIQTIANGLSNFFKENWIYTQDDYTYIGNLLRDLGNSCDVVKLYAAFGTVSTIFYGSGDLDYWFGQIPSSDAKQRFRSMLYGVNNF